MVDDPALQLDALGSVAMRLGGYQSRSSRVTFCVRSALQLRCSEVRDRITSLNAVLHQRISGVTCIEGFS
jgi:hypothetical protein